MKRNEIQYWLREEDPDRLAALYGNSDSIRRARVGEQVHLRGIIEFSNHCRNNCGYCGLRAANRRISRYRMSQDEILECVHVTRRLGYGTVVLQAGEDPFLTTKWMAELVRRIKGESGLVVTLSLGEYSRKGLDWT